MSSLTIKQLDEIKENTIAINYLNKDTLECVSCSKKGKLYAYLNYAGNVLILYRECKEHLEYDKNYYKGLKMIELSEKEIFYLKI